LGLHPALELPVQSFDGVGGAQGLPLLWRIAAEQGYAEAQCLLGVMYGNGNGVPQNYILAHMWYNLATSQGHDNAKPKRDLVATRMTPAQITEAQRFAREWKPTK
jgi:TPR repeat protein